MFGRAGCARSNEGSGTGRERASEEPESPRHISLGAQGSGLCLGIHPLVGLNVFVSWYPMYLHLEGLALLLEAMEFLPEGVQKVLAGLGFGCSDSGDGGLAVNEQGGLGGSGCSPDQIEAKKGSAYLGFKYCVFLGGP